MPLCEPCVCVCVMALEMAPVEGETQYRRFTAMKPSRSLLTGNKGNELAGKALWFSVCFADVLFSSLWLSGLSHGVSSPFQICTRVYSISLSCAVLIHAMIWYAMLFQTQSLLQIKVILIDCYVKLYSYVRTMCYILVLYSLYISCKAFTCFITHYNQTEKEQESHTIVAFTTQIAVPTDYTKLILSV